MAVGGDAPAPARLGGSARAPVPTAAARPALPAVRLRPAQKHYRSSNRRCYGAPVRGGAQRMCRHHREGYAQSGGAVANHAADARRLAAVQPWDTQYHLGSWVVAAEWGGAGWRPHLEEDVGRVEVAVADALAVEVRDGGGRLLQQRQDDLRAVGQLAWQEGALDNGMPEAAAVAVLLQHARQSGIPRAPCSLGHSCTAGPSSGGSPGRPGLHSCPSAPRLRCLPC